MAKPKDIKTPHIARKIKLMRFLNKESKNIVTKYKSFLSRKRGVSNDDAPPNKASTIKQKGKNHWMVATGETKNKGIEYRVKKRGVGKYGMLVFGSGQRHSGKRLYKGKKVQGKSRPTYRSIFRYNNTAKGRYSGIFQYLPYNSKFPERLVNEIGKQTLEIIKRSYPKNIRMNIG